MLRGPCFAALLAAASLAYWCAVASLPAALTAQGQTRLPEGEGKALVERVCTACHGPTEITNARLNRERWSSMVDDMVSRGAEATDEELDKIVEYLAANFARPKIGVNKATARELASALGLSADDAEAIVTYREKNGKFKEWDDLKKVPSIDMKKMAANKDRFEY
jgi:competence protein ComEA